jgi:hypothetical protein
MGARISKYKPSAGQSLPTPIFDGDKLHYGDGVLFNLIHDKYGPVHIVQEDHK